MKFKVHQTLHHCDTLPNASRQPGNLEGTDLGWTARYISRMESSSFVMLACCATMSFTCEIMVPNSEAANRKRTLQNI
jgi:hypothetical protein